MALIAESCGVPGEARSLLCNVVAGLPFFFHDKLDLTPVAQAHLRIPRRFRRWVSVRTRPLLLSLLRCGTTAPGFLRTPTLSFVLGVAALLVVMEATGFFSTYNNASHLSLAVERQVTSSLTAIVFYLSCLAIGYRTGTRFGGALSHLVWCAALMPMAMFAIDATTALALLPTATIIGPDALWADRAAFATSLTVTTVGGGTVSLAAAFVGRTRQDRAYARWLLGKMTRAQVRAINREGTRRI